MTPAARFALRMAWREARGAGRRFALFFACVAVGVAALVAVGSVTWSLERALARSARALLGADVEIRATQPLGAAARGVLAELGRRGVEATSVLELAAMARGAAPDRASLVELKAVEPAYPFYGRLEAVPAAARIGEGRALVHPALLERLGLAPGDRLRIGEGEFTIAGAIAQEPDRAVGVFTLGPRVLIAAPDLERTALVRPGSRVRYRTLLRLPEGMDAEAFRDELARRLDEPGLRIATYSQAQPGLRRFWDQLAVYLGLTGLVALMVGGIGVAMGVHAFVRGKLATIAVLKALGASSRTVLAVYLLETVLLGLGGSLLGAVLGGAVLPLAGPVLGQLLALDVPLVPSPRAVLGGLGMGVGVTVLWALWPLLEVRRVRPALLLRAPVEPALGGRPPWPALAVIAAGLAALCIWQAGSVRVGALFVGGLGGALLLLALGARGVVALARRGRARSLALRHGLANLHRPGSQATAVLVSLGLAVMLIVAVACLDGSLRRQIARTSAVTAPAFFFIDVQPDQQARFRELLREQAGEDRAELIPVVRARLAALDGAPVSAGARARGDDPWYLTREYMLTWAAGPPGRDTVVGGRWWTPEEAAREPLASVEEDLARRLGVHLGSTVTFDVLGVPVTARVQSLRRVEWQTLAANFFVILSPGALDAAPHTLIATARVPPAREAAVQAAVVAAFPNVTAVPVREVLERVDGVLAQIALAMRVVAAFSALGGLVVMAGALGVTRAQRLYHSVLLRTLGATRAVVARVFAVEYAVTGAAAGVIGSALAAVLSWAVLRFALDVPFAWAPAALLGGVAGATALATLVGALGTWRLLGQKPLPVLRGE